MRRRADIPADLFLDEPAADGEEGGEEKPSKRQTDKTAKRYTTTKRGKRVGRPPVLEGPKEPVTLYLTEPAAHRLEEARYLLLTKHDLKTTKSALADYALRHGLEDLTKVAEELGRARQTTADDGG